MYTPEEAITHLLNNEAKVTRSVRDEGKNPLMRWQVIQATANVRYLQNCVEGDTKMASSRLAAAEFYQKPGLNSRLCKK
jgi:glycyl-tRNA synthetase beta subunit